ncbi:hypothetical protein S245_071034, partial [Arachis hypogaea]
ALFCAQFSFRRKLDLQNYSRDLKTLIIDVNAQMCIDNLKNKHEMNNSFYYDCELIKEGKLKNLFWANVSFGTTYGTNKYDMIFVPFT